jgi:AcrR family transcriptional regulator
VNSPNPPSADDAVESSKPDEIHSPRRANRSPGRATRSAVADNRARQSRGNKRRQQILDAAVELFAAKGYQRTGVAALAQRVGMTATGMLYYFGSKERLLVEVVAERDRANANTTLNTLESLASLRNIGQLNVETATLTRLYVLLGAENLDPDEPLHDFFADRYETGRELVRTILRSEQERGTVRLDIDVDQVGREVMGVVMGTEIQWLTDPERVDLAATIAAYIDRLVIDLAPEPNRDDRHQVPPGPPAFDAEP